VHSLRGGTWYPVQTPFEVADSILDPHPLTVAPFALLLLAIALMPLIAPKYWENNWNKAVVAGLLSVPTVGWLLIRDPSAILHSLKEYSSFTALLGSLFVVSGGIHLEGDLRATPARNTALLALGGILANVLGTTGASMLLIRTVLRTNSQRSHVAYLPFFFILIVSNCGGLLTPLGDPPLFLGYLRGVPFTWTLRLWPVWTVAMAWLLGLYYIIDRRNYAREDPSRVAQDAREAVPLSLLGWRNVALLFGVVASVLLPAPYREIGMAGLALVSMVFGGTKARQANGFTFGPIVEVSILFAGIFLTMIPALQLLKVHGATIGLTRPWHYFVASGSLSSVLDNAPTYLTFLSAAQGLGHNGPAGVPDACLAAISAGCVLMGANTYIGNGPNFMVKAIADDAGYRTASFGRHAVAAVLVLMPIYVFTALWVSYCVG
jgi:Na+/H+ antiporter NhaD/arsenite permease-like protein